MDPPPAQPDRRQKSVRGEELGIRGPGRARRRRGKNLYRSYLPLPRWAEKLALNFCVERAGNQRGELGGSRPYLLLPRCRQLLAPEIIWQKNTRPSEPERVFVCFITRPAASRTPFADAPTGGVPFSCPLPSIRPLHSGYRRKRPECWPDPGFRQASWPDHRRRQRFRRAACAK